MPVLEPINQSFFLEQMCEANYHKLLRLVPNLLSIQRCALGTARQRLALQLKVLERSRFTLTVELNYHFTQAPEKHRLPALKIRVYRDVKSAEVLRDHARSDVAQVFKDRSQSVAIMRYKWQLNYFLTQWLDYCLAAHYQFQEPVSA